MNAIKAHDFADGCDEMASPSRTGHRHQSEPSFVFFDDAREADPDILWGRELALDFEEWVAKQNHEEALDANLERPVRFKKTHLRVERRPLTEPTSPKAVVKSASEQEKRWAKAFRIASHPLPKEEEVVLIDLESDYNHPVEEDQLAYEERIESKRFANWLINFHKHRPQANDRWHKTMLLAAQVLEKPESKALFKALQEALPYAPGPIKGTVFVNPDGSRHETTGVSFGSAKVSYQRRHQLTDEFVSVDRVQYEGQRGSKLIVGTRKTSDTTPSRYYDSNPEFHNRLKNGEADPNSYVPKSGILMAVPEDMVMPPGSHRLTVRQLERSIIAGATLCDDEFDLDALDIDDEFYDTRISVLNYNMGSEGRAYEGLTDGEQFLFDTLQMMGESEMCDLIVSAEQSPYELANMLCTGEMDDYPMGCMGELYQGQTILTPRYGKEFEEWFIANIGEGRHHKLQIAVLLRAFRDKEDAEYREEMRVEAAYASEKGLMLTQIDDSLLAYVAELVRSTLEADEYQVVYGERYPWDPDRDVTAEGCDVVVRDGFIKVPAYHNWKES